MEDVPVFDETELAEVKMEIVEDDLKGVYDGISSSTVTEHENELLGLQPEIEDYRSQSDSDSEIYSEISSGSVSGNEELFASIPNEPDYPSVTQTGPSTKLPSYMESVLEDFRDQLIFSKSRKLHSELKNNADLNKANKLLLEWQQKYPEGYEKLEKQLTHELLAYTFVKSSVKIKKSREYHDGNEDILDDGDMIAQIEDCGFFASVIPTTESGDSEILNFFNKLKEHKSFEKYRNYIDTLSEDQISSLVWDASVKAQRIIMKLSKLHELSLTTLDKIIKLNRDIAESIENECQVIEQHVNAEAAKVEQIAGKSELTTVGRKQLHRSLLAPYFKTESGFAAPFWKPVPVPFKFEDLRQATLTSSESELLQASIVETVRGTKKAYIENRCCQLLLKSAELGNIPPTVEYTLFSCPQNSSSPSTSRSNIRVKIECSIETLLRWKADSIKRADSISLDEIISDPSISIDWLSVSENMNSHTTKSLLPDEFQRIWEKLIRPGLITNKKMNLAQIQKLMESVKTNGTRKWDIVAKDMGPDFTPFLCFSAYERFRPGELSAHQRSNINKRELQAGSSSFHKIVKLGKEFLPHMPLEKFSMLSCQVAGLLVETPNIPLQALAENYNRFSNPDTVKGTFRLVEDLLLLVCMVKMREYLKLAASFAPLKDYLPWRFISLWATRADVLFSQKKTFWSREEDLKLLNFARTHRKFDWKLFSLQLGLDKNRKNTRGRYIFLQERLKSESFDQLRDEYESKERTRRLYLDYTKLLAPLETTLSLPQCKPPSYDELRTNPSESTLWSYLASFDKGLIQETISDLKQIIIYSTEAQKLESTKNKTEGSGEFHEIKKACACVPKKPIDRRKFVRGDAESTASAIHLRKLTLKSKYEAGPLSPYQEEIYLYFGAYKGRSVKSTTKHNYIPKIELFMKMEELKKIVDWPSSITEEDIGTDGVLLDVKGCPIVTDLPKPPRRRKRKGVISDKKGRKKKVNPEQIKNESSDHVEEDDNDQDDDSDLDPKKKSKSE